MKYTTLTSFRDGLGPTDDHEFGKDVTYVALRGTDLDHQLFSNGFVRGPCGQQAQDFQFPFGQWLSQRGMRRQG